MIALSSVVNTLSRKDGELFGGVTTSNDLVSCTPSLIPITEAVKVGECLNLLVGEWECDNGICMNLEIVFILMSMGQEKD